MKKSFLKLFGLLAIVVLSGCTATGKYTTPLVQTNQVVKADKAAIVFFRASNYGGAITSPLVQVEEDGSSSLVGIIGPKEKMIKYVEPGEHTFMIIGENADFMKANVEAGKIYYSIIRPRLGFWKARFSLTPFKEQPEHQDYNIAGKNLPKWLNECSYTEPNEAAFTWHKGKTSELKELYNKYYPAWKQKAVAKRDAATLLVTDGVAQEL